MRFRQGWVWLSVGLEKIVQRMERHGHDVRHPPRRRYSYLAICPMDALREHIADDCCNSAVTIEHRCSGRTMINNEAVFALIQFQERHAGNLAIVSYTYEPSSYDARAAFRIGDGYNLLFRRKRLPPNRNGVGVSDS